MVFGEIIEPSTRALIDDDYEEYPETFSLQYDWSNSESTPKNINKLIFTETKEILFLIKRCLLLQPKDLYTSIEKAGINVFSLNNDNYLVSCNSRDVCTGEITAKFIPWIEKAKQIITLTSAPVTSYQHLGLDDLPVSFFRMLSTRMDHQYELLNPPNLVTGLGANIFSYCVHINQKCQLFVLYIDSAPLDSISSKPFVDFLKSLNIGNVSLNFSVNNLPTNNLYM